MSSQYLVGHAKDNVWCSPDQDYQSIFEPKLISPKRGSKRFAKVEWQDIPLPNQDEVFHVYQIGNVPPGVLGLFPKSGQWISATDHCNIQGMVIDIYTGNGVQLPRFEVFIAVLFNRNVILAVKNQGTRIDLNVTPIYIRFYSNAFFESERRSEYPEIPQSVSIQNPQGAWTNVTGQRASSGDILVEGKRLETRQELADLQYRLGQMRALGFGHVYAFYNGAYVNDFSQLWYTADRFKEGDWAELVFDSSIREVIEFPVSSLDTFPSKLDEVHKYLLHRYEDVVDHIQYRDDIDIFLTKIVNPATGRFRGVYYHRNQDIAMRMVTHQDYSIPVAFVTGYENAVEGFTDPNSWIVRLHIREAGYKRDLVNEHNRIKELYKLAPFDRRRAMLGIDSLECWTARFLEDSLYTSFMRNRYADFTRGDVEQAYGYNAVSKLIADSPLNTVTEGDQKLVKLPAGLWNNATIYEYDAGGRLLGWSPSRGSTTYACRYPNCAFVEGRIGIGSNYLSTVYGIAPSDISPDYDYGFFKAAMVQGRPSSTWQKANEGEDYVLLNGKVYWNLSAAQWHVCVKNNQHFLSYVIDQDATDGLTIFSIQANEDDVFAPENRVLSIPVGKLDIFMNGYPLIEGVDYFVNWPTVVVCAKRYYVSEGSQRVVVRGTGLPMVDEDGKFVREKPLDSGFVQYGQLSHNKRFDLRDDRVQRIVVAGAVKRATDVSYPENRLGVDVVGVTNGQPYAIEEVIVPVGEFTDSGTYPLRALSQERDQEVSDYLTLKLPEPEEPEANPIPERYEIYSPFFSKVMHDLLDSYLVIDGIDEHYPDSKVKEWLADYEYLLRYDPCLKNLDDRYILIEPHEQYDVVEVDVYQYNLLRRAVKVYLGDKVNMSRWVSIKDEFVPITPS